MMTRITRRKAAQATAALAAALGLPASAALAASPTVEPGADPATPRPSCPCVTSVRQCRETCATCLAGPIAP